MCRQKFNLCFGVSTNGAKGFRSQAADKKQHLSQVLHEENLNAVSKHEATPTDVAFSCSTFLYLGVSCGTTAHILHPSGKTVSIKPERNK